MSFPEFRIPSSPRPVSSEYVPSTCGEGQEHNSSLPRIQLGRSTAGVSPFLQKFLYLPIACGHAKLRSALFFIGPGGTSLRILLIDDSPVALRALRTVLGLNPGWQIVGTAESGPEGLKMFRELHPDVVIVDFQMPGMSGIDVGREIRRTGSTVLLLLFTLYAGSHLDHAAKEAGFDGVFSKTAAYPIVAIIEKMRPGELEQGSTESATMEVQGTTKAQGRSQARS